METQFYGTGKRKCAVARVWLRPGAGQILINRRPLEQYFGREISRLLIQEPFRLTETVGRYDVLATVAGGGLAGQADAVRHGISKALLLTDPSLRAPLKRAGLLTRDSRVKERKKSGQKGARARFQFSKR